MGELYAQALEETASPWRRSSTSAPQQIADKALQNGQIDMYPEYTGTSLVEIYGKRRDQPDTPEATYQKAKQLYAKRDPADTMLTPAPFNNTYGIFVQQGGIAEEYDLKTWQISRRSLGELAFVLFSEFKNREDGYPNMQENYPASTSGTLSS